MHIVENALSNLKGIERIDNLLAQAKTDGRQSSISRIRALIPELLP